MTTSSMDCHEHRNCSCHTKAAPASQNLDELGFLKSACSAAQRGDVKRLADILAKSPESVNDDGVAGQSGYTPLHYAARAGNLDAVLLLIEAGADVNRTTRAGGATPLHRAAYMGQAAITEALLKRGADASLKDADGHTPLHKAIAQGHDSTAQLLWKWTGGHHQ